MSNLLKHAKDELKLIGMGPKVRGMNGMMRKNILELVEVFAAQNHSGMSANYLLGIFPKLAAFESITPLTGAPEEWHFHGHDTGAYQNKRNGAVFKDTEDGQAYYLDGIVFRDQNGGTFTNKYSRVPVTFPYTPSTQIIDVYIREEK